MSKDKDGTPNIVEYNYIETPIQQAVLNIIDSINSMIVDRGIPKILKVEALIYNANRLQLIGADTTPKLVYALKVKICTFKSVKQTSMKKAIPQKEVTIFEHVEQMKAEPGKKIPTEEEVMRACDQCFMQYLREAINIQTIVADQRNSQKNEQRQGEADANPSGH